MATLKLYGASVGQVVTLMPSPRYVSSTSLFVLQIYVHFLLQHGYTADEVSASAGHDNIASLLFHLRQVCIVCVLCVYCVYIVCILCVYCVHMHVEGCPSVLGELKRDF